VATRSGRRGAGTPGRRLTAAELAELGPWAEPQSGNGRRRTAAELAEDSPWREPPGRRQQTVARRAVRPRYEAVPREDVEAPRRVSPLPDPHFAPPAETTPRPIRALVSRPPRPSPTLRRPATRPRPAQPLALAARRAGAYATTSWRQRRPWLIVGGLIAAGLVLRLLLMRGIWVDEAISVHQAQMSLPDMLDDLRETDRHPPLHHLVLWLVVRLFGVGELAVRAPSIVASLALVPALFVTARELFDRRTGLVAAALGAVAPLVIWYGQEARMYALFMLLATLALWAQVMVLRDGRRRYWVAYGAITIALLYTHYFALVPIAIQQLVFAIAAWKRARAGLPVRSLILGCWLTWTALLVAAAPLAPFAHEQFQHDQAAGTGFGGVPGAGSPSTPEGSSVSAYAVLSNFVWAIWGYHADSTMLRIAALWPLLMLFSLALLGQRRSASTRVVLALALGPVILLLLVGLSKRDLFEVRYFVGAVPMMLLLLARAVAGGARRRTPALVASAVLVGTLLAGLADQQLNSRNPRSYDFKGALTTVAERARPGDTIVYAPDYLRDVIAYYAPGVEAVALEDRPTAAARGRVFLLASFLDNEALHADVGAARARLQQRGRLLDREQRQQIWIWEYASSDRERASADAEPSSSSPSASSSAQSSS
jgi:uncharacterized membrane protein